MATENCNSVVFRQSADGLTWEARTADNRQDVVGMIGLRTDGVYEVMRFSRDKGFCKDAVDTLDQAQAWFN